ncbi:hypothetical protein SLS53_006172 [Cytospora paraplurivora]|uniref:Xylose isomerase-like TIM barrel domain-containing protein n=1 Tax=Cytospora paraplurivora TaxID=2898453 RepID=A0AAN9U3P5_9PEZI
MPCKLGITSMSLGRASAGHCLTHRLDLAQAYGYQGIELFLDDLVEESIQFLDMDVTIASSAFEPQLSSDRFDVRVLAARIHGAMRIRKLCAERNLTIICLQPFANYEGLLDRQAHQLRLVELEFWIQVAHALGTDMIQIPSSYLPAAQVSDNMGLMARDLQEVADLGAQARPRVRFVYEALCWGTRVDTWEKSWELVKRVNRDNFGLCLDSFNIAGRIYADPTSPTGTAADADEAVRNSMARLVKELRPHMNKVFYVQIVDAERLSRPLVEGHAFHNPEQPPRMSWSRNCRLFYGEKEYGAYLPIRQIAETLFHQLGYEGWVSLELFNRLRNESLMPGVLVSDVGATVPEQLASRGAESWRRLVRDLDLVVESRSLSHPGSFPEIAPEE